MALSKIIVYLPRDFYLYTHALFSRDGPTPHGEYSQARSAGNFDGLCYMLTVRAQKAT